MPHIGVLNEKSLHKSLKHWYSQPGDRLEVALGGFVIDIVRDDLLIEIQTGSFASIKAKLTQLLREHRIRLIYPVVQEKWIVRVTPGGRGEVIRRKSPKKGRAEDLFRELVSIPQLLSNPNFSIEILMIREEEVRRYVGKRQWRRRGWAIEGRRLLEVLDQRVLSGSADWLRFVPENLESFTSGDLAAATATREDLARKMAYCLREGSLIELIGKRGRANLYRVPRG